MENKFGFSHKPMPNKCPDCGQELSKIKRGIEFDKNWKQTSPKILRSDTIYRECQCGCLIVWAYRNNFVRRHVLELFDDKLILGSA